MKSKIKFLVLLLALSITSAINPKQISAQQDYVSFQVFYDALAPYGEWVDYENYGYAWIPDAGEDFVPYSTAGYWLLTDYGWTWVSDYEWGWAPFHYGRWDYNNYYGWLWIPDNEWGPSWVNWRRANGYYGWSPMEPGISISVSFGRPYDRNHDHWMFVRENDFERHDLNRYSVNHAENAVIIRNSTVIKNTYIDSRRTTYVAGPLREDVQRVVGRRINPVAIEENSRPGKDSNNGDLRIYRPRVEKTIVNQPKPVPSRVTNIKDVKQPSERKGSNQPGNARPQNNNNVQQDHPRNINPPKSIERQQQNIERQQNNGSRTQPSQQPGTAVPTGNNGRTQQPAVTRPVNNTNPEKRVQPNNVVLPNNRGNVQQPAAVKPGNTNAVQPRNANNGREQQPIYNRPQNNSNQVQPSQQRSSEPARVQQPSAPRQQNPNASRPVRISPPANDRKQQQQNSVKPQNIKSNEQPKQSRQEREK